jgi:hypothetical protein
VAKAAIIKSEHGNSKKEECIKNMIKASNMNSQHDLQRKRSQSAKRFLVDVSNQNNAKRKSNTFSEV